MTVKIYSLPDFKNVSVCTLSGLSNTAVSVFFEEGSLDCYTISSSGQLSVWDCNLDPSDLLPGKFDMRQKKRSKSAASDDDNGSDDSEASDEEQSNKDKEKDAIQLLNFKRSGRHFLSDHVEGKERYQVTACDYHQKTKIMVAGFDNGVFLLLSLPDVSLIHSLSISDQSIGTLSFNQTGDWIAFGCPDLGQLLVWEWQSETYVLKQQGHTNGMTSVAYSPDGSLIATSGEDAKVKLWNTSSGFCFVTFAEHEATVTGICFTPNGKVVLSSSLDGTVRAFDMTRYRNFKTFTTPRPVQLSCITVDASGDMIASGGQDVFEIYLWSLTTGRLVEILSGHEGPVSGVAFSSNPISSQLASVSWDKTLKIWDALESNSSRETIQITSEGTCVCWRPDGINISVGTLSGHIYTFDVISSTQVSSIAGRKDLRMGKGEADKISAKTKSESQAFKSLCYSADGCIILAGGSSKYICIYNVQEQILLKKFEITQNRSFDCMDEIINRRKMTEFGNLALVEDRSDDSKINLPGTKAKDMSSRTVKLEITVSGLRFSPTGRSFSAVTTEGLLVYSLDRQIAFDPFLLDTNITPQSIRASIESGAFSKSLIDAFKLNEKPLVRESIEQIPVKDIDLIVKQWPIMFLKRLMNHIALEMENSKHLEFYIKWSKSIFLQHGTYIKDNCKDLMPVLNLLIKNVGRKSEDLSKVCEHNKYTVKYLLNVGRKNDALNIQDEFMELDEAGDEESEEESDDESEIDMMTGLQSNWNNDDPDVSEQEQDMEADNDN